MLTEEGNWECVCLGGEVCVRGRDSIRKRRMQPTRGKDDVIWF